ncbi:MAG: hypothetical protein Rhims3KO_25890 [Hyphomicrobiales bacterium]
MSIKRADDPGALPLRVEVLEPVIAEDDMGGGTATFTVRHKLWAAFEPDGPSQRSADPVSNSLATGRLMVRLGNAPSIGWRIAWVQAGLARSMEIAAVEPGRADFPFDVCAVREVTP